MKLHNNVTQPKCNIVSYGLNSFRYKGPKIWNSLPNYVKEAISLSEFKFLIKSWMGPHAFVISARLCWKPIWTTDKDQSITFCSYNIYYNSNVHTKTFVSMCKYVVMDLI